MLVKIADVVKVSLDELFRNEPKLN